MADLRLAGSEPFKRTLLQRLGPVGKTGVLAVPLSLAAGAQEFDDEEDLGTNIKQAGARAGADLATTLALAKIGALFGGPIGAVGLPTAAAVLGVQDKIGAAAADIFNMSTEDKIKKKLREAALYRDFDQETANMNEERMRRILAQQIRAQQNAQLQSEGAANLNTLLNIGY
tara:strand:+ start:159 stop:674 length:516 start_codon:yes stop_codon:yes gene_type:complete